MASQPTAALQQGNFLYVPESDSSAQVPTQYGQAPGMPGNQTQIPQHQFQNNAQAGGQQQVPGQQQYTEVPPVQQIPMYNFGQQFQNPETVAPQAQGPDQALLQRIAELEGRLNQTPSTNSQLESKFEKLVEVMTKNQAAPQTDYLSMSADQLLDAINGGEDGKTSKIVDILQSIKEQAVQEAENKFGSRLENLTQTQQAMIKQHLQVQAMATVQRVEQTYARDPNFKENMAEAGKWLATPAGQAFIEVAPESAIENAYLMIKARQLNDPQYQQQLALSLQNTQNLQNIQRMQAGPGPGITQNQVPLSQQTMAQPQQGQIPNDMEALQKVLSMGNHLGVPNVRIL